jgi:hypothetical protein
MGIGLAFRKYRRFLSVIGAGIVLITFVVNQVVRDHLKDLVDSTEKAQSIFSIKDGNRIIQQQLQGISNLLRYFEPEINRTNPDFAKNSPSSFVQEEDLWDDILQGDKRELANVSDILEVVPGQETLIKQVNTLGDEIETLRNQNRHFLNDCLAQLEPAWGGEPIHVAPNKSAIEIAGRRCEQDFENVQQGSADISSKIKDAKAQTIRVALDFRNRYEQKYRRYTWASYVLYAVGWMLAVLGRAYGFELPAVAE